MSTPIVSNLGDFQLLPQEIREEIFTKLEAHECARLRELSNGFTKIMSIELIVQAMLRSKSFVPILDRLYTNPLHSAEFVKHIICILFTKATHEQQEALFKKSTKKVEILQDLPADLESLFVYEPPKLDLLTKFHNLKSLGLGVVFAPPQEYAVLSQLTSLKYLLLRSAHNFGDAEMAHLQGLTQLSSLRLGNCGTSAGLNFSGLAQITHLASLTSLQIEQIAPDLPFTPSSLEEFKQLKTLVLSNTTVNDGHCEEIESLTNLRVLKLEEGLHITERGLGRLASLSQLKQLNLQGCTQLSQRNVRRIFSQSPHLQIQM